MTRLASVLTVLGVLLAAGPARAQTMVFRHSGTVYADGKDQQLRAPEGVACGKGEIAIADTGNGRLVRMTWVNGIPGAGVEVKLQQIAHPTRLAFDSKGTLLVLDRKARKIARVDPKNAFLGHVELRNAGGTLPVVPVAFKLDASDNVYVIDAATHAVIVADAGGTVNRQIPLPAGKNSFTDLTIDGTGTIYAVDPVGAVVWSAAKGATAFTAITKALKETASFPTTITTDNKGKLLLVDQNGAGVVVLGLDGSFQGRQLAMGWNDGLLYYPTQLCMDGNQEAFIADRSNQRVQVFSVTQ